MTTAVPSAALAMIQPVCDVTADPHGLASSRNRAEPALQRVAGSRVGPLQIRAKSAI